MVAIANRKPLKLLVEERRRRILDLLHAEDRVTVEDLVERFDVSAVTIRGDLDALANGGSLVRSHGGALKSLDDGDIRISVKETLNHREKLRIGHAAARLLRSGDTVILDSGTTTAEIAKQIKSLKLSALTVVTNGLNVAMHLGDVPYVRLFVIGGLMRHLSYSTVGPQAEQMLSGLTADHLFLGVDGLDPEVGLTTPDVLEAQLNSLMIRMAREVTIVADSSKFSKRSFSVIAGLDDVRRVITDHKADPQMVSTLRERGIDVMLV